LWIPFSGWQSGSESQPANKTLHSTTKAAPTFIDDFMRFLPAAFAACELGRSSKPDPVRVIHFQ
jgi:hypothetical protein